MIGGARLHPGATQHVRKILVRRRPGDRGAVFAAVATGVTMLWRVAAVVTMAAARAASCSGVRDRGRSPAAQAATSGAPRWAAAGMAAPRGSAHTTAVGMGAAGRRATAASVSVSGSAVDSCREV